MTPPRSEAHVGPASEIYERPWECGHNAPRGKLPKLGAPPKLVDRGIILELVSPTRHQPGTQFEKIAPSERVRAT